MLKTSLLAVLAVFVLAQPAMAADTPAGDVTAVKGNVVLHQSGRSVPSGVAKGDKLFAGDEISTESKSSVTVTFANGGTVGIGPKGVMTINATPQQVGVKINNAGFAATGESPAIETACGTVTVKTGNLVQAEKEGACFAYVTEGTAMIKNNAGLTVLTAG
ncbi:MAG: hypothetical protein KKA05_08795, partial [Alphaproteobacteria bacterium]|nr:hypothetical protein [Alphaproteobacteria bacterium]